MKIEIEGEIFQISDSELWIKNPEFEAFEIASKIFSIGKLVARLRRKLDETTITYRNRKAQEILKMLSQNKKISEWKARAMIEASPIFITLKNNQAIAKEEYEQAHLTHQALIQKSMLIQSLLRCENKQNEVQKKPLKKVIKKRKVEK